GEVRGVEERHEADLGLQRIDPERHERRAVRGVRHRDLELDAVGVLDQAEQLLKLLAREARLPLRGLALLARGLWFRGCRFWCCRPWVLLSGDVAALRRRRAVVYLLRPVSACASWASKASRSVRWIRSRPKVSATPSSSRTPSTCGLTRARRRVTRSA